MLLLKLKLAFKGNLIVDLVDFSLILFLGSIGAGFLGAASGLGGGIVLIPLLILFFKVDTLYALGASLMGVIATSIGASVHFLKKEKVHIRISAFLETATVPGAIGGAWLATQIHEGIILVLFGLLLISLTIQSKIQPIEVEEENYPKHPFWGWVIMLGAGLFSGLLGIGSGALKVIGMDRVMRIPFRVATATSSFMIGVTAAASATPFYHLGYISPTIVMSMVPGVLIGSLLGAKLVSRINIDLLRNIFSLLICLLSIELIIEGYQRLFQK